MRYGSRIEPPNRFEAVHREIDEHEAGPLARKPDYFRDESKSIVVENKSPDIPFRYSLNPYRGCLHGCSYCYARVSHEYLGMNAGSDFESKIAVKENAATLLREFLIRPKWRPEPIVFSGITDCYQPVERNYQLTRQCLETALEFRQPVSIITKNSLVLRDLDILKQLQELRLVHVYLSITTLDKELAGSMEPKTSTPAARLHAVEQLANAEVPVGIMMAPIVPGLTDEEIPNLLKSAKDAGSKSANYIMLRLPLNVETVFMEWLKQARPNLSERVESRIRQVRGGNMNSTAWGERMSGTGVFAEQVRQTFEVFCRKLGLDRRLPPQDCSQFKVPEEQSGQLRLF